MATRTKFLSFSFWVIAFLLLTQVTPALALDPKLPAQLKRYVESLSSKKEFKNATLGVKVVEAKTGREVFSHQADTLLIPASVMKIITSVAVLRSFGSDHTFPTEIFILRNTEAANVKLDPSAGLAKEELSKENAEAPDIFVRGYGNPTLVEEELLSVAKSIREMGVTRIRSLIIDDSLFVDPPGPTGYRAYEAGASAVSINNNAYAVTVAPSSSLGKAHVQLTPGLDYSLRSNVKTRSSRGSSIKVTQSPSSSSFNTKLLGSRVGNYFNFPRGKVSVNVQGKIGKSSGVKKKYYSVRNPSKYFADLLKHSLRLNGVSVARVLKGQTPSQAELLYTFQSAPLKEVVQKMNHFSSNHIAMQLLFAMGQEKTGLFKKELGLSRMREVLSDLSYSPSDFTINDASGLSRSNRISSAQLVAVLASVYQDFSIAPDFISSLSRFGSSGTLKTRNLFEAPSSKSLSGGLFSKIAKRASSVWAKTGTLNGVSSLAGFLVNRDNQAYAFSIIINGKMSKKAAVQVEDELVKRISGIVKK